MKSIIGLVLLPCVVLVALTTNGSAQSKPADTTAAAQTQKDMTVFGFHLGETFAVPECQRDSLPQRSSLPGEEYYSYGDAADCFTWALLLVPAGIKPNTPVVNDNVFLHLKNGPLYAYGYMNCLVIDGNLESIIVYTGGWQRQDYWLAALKEKYGEPKHTEEVNKQNGLGAVFASHKVAWRFPNLPIDFSGTTDATDMGSIDIYTDKALEFLTGSRGVDHPKPQNQVGPKL